MKLIVIDAGHGGSDSGATGYGELEKNINLDIANRVVRFLNRDYECRMIMTRTDNSTVSLKQRSDLANKKDADFFFSIHCNASGGSGFESFIYEKLSDRSRTYDMQAVIHQTVYSHTLKPFNIKNRGRKKANFHVLRETKMPAVLVETLFIDYKADSTLLKDGVFLDSIAESYAKGVALANALPKKKKETTTLYVVQAGAYKLQKNAEKQVARLKGLGVPAFIVPKKEEK